MWQPLLVLAFLASVLLITPLEGSSSRATASSFSSSGSNSSGGSAYAIAYSSSSSSPRSRPKKPKTCPNNSKRCPKPNEVYDRCPALCPPRECGVDPAVILCAPSPTPGDPECQPGCRCRDNYLRNSSGICVYKDDCPSPKRCPKPNEVYDPCPALCPPQECGVDPAVILCLPSPKLGDPECQPGCRCRDDYLRNSSGICVYKDDCPICPYPNEVYDECPAPCPPRLCDVDDRLIRCAAPPEPGDEACDPGCRCADGYVRNNEGVCVTRDQCPPKCGEREVYSKCPVFSRRPLKCSQVGFPVNYPSEESECPVKPACICEEGYVKNKKGYCIPIKECPSCGGDYNATSGCGVNCGRLCSNYKSKDVGCIEICYENACDCKEKYVLDENTKQCVLPKDCTPACGKDEEYSTCINGGCQPKTCSEVGFPIKCAKLDPKSCIKGCLCKEDYVRADNGTCIPKNQCPSCGGDENAVAGCGGNCGRRCSDVGKGPIACPAICNLNGCDCKPGLLLDDNTGKCVEPKQCSPVCTGKNEVYSNCTNGGCGPKECSGLGFRTGCVKMDLKYCRGGCTCKDRYLRNENGECIPKSKCPECGGDANAVYGCGINCNRHCSDIGKEPQSCIAVCYDDACDCKKGLFLDDNTGKCVPREECTPTCGENEVFSSCVNGGCSRKNCSQLGKPVPCVRPRKCYNGCLCKEGWLRAKNGVCVPEDQCTQPQCGKNERLENCPETLCTPQNCSQIGFPLPAIPCTVPENGTCQGPPACVCIDDYVKDDDGNCIPKRDCPSCGGDPNAVSGCGVNCGRLCSNYDKGPVPCIKICKVNACDCREDYVLDENTNRCVLPQNCTPTCGVNEVYDSCGNSGCRKWKCSQPPLCIDTFKCEGACVCKDKYTRADNGTCIPEEECEQCNKPHEYYDSCAPTCPPQTCESIGRKYKCPAQALYCKGACRCEKGYYRNKNNDCITEKQCKKCTGPNEYYSCGGACDNVCATLNEQNQTNCPIVNIKCNEKCYCLQGFARDSNDICIPIEQCPKPQCPKGERYEECPDNLCTPQNCSQLGFNIPCPEFSGNSSSTCPGKPGCVCDNDYVRDDQGKCIPRDQCLSCGGDPNAVSGCGGNCGRLCSNYDKGPVACPLICNLNGCDCKPDFVYDENTKKCVLPEDCNRCDKPHEYYDSCAPTCPPQTCESIGRKYKCPAQALFCRGACRCEKGYYRNKNNDCITAKQCKKCTGPNEYYACGGACDNVCATLNKQNQTNCPIRNIKCNEMCYCKEGYARNDKKICIPIEQCPKPQCPDGERYEENPDSICAPLNCSQIGFPVACPSSGNTSCNNPTPPGCVCENDNVRDNQGNCIPRNECPSCGGDSNATAGCSNYCGNRCSDYNQTVFCPLFCDTNGCRCKKELVYDDNLKKCVDPKDCTPTCGINEVYSSCGNGGCRRWNCSDGKAILCIDPIECKGGCVCQDGYSRANNGTCIPEDQCPPECPEGERYEECTDNLCSPLTCSQLGYPLDCPGLSGNSNTECSGEPGCVCDNNYVRDDDGNCIPRDQCPSCGGDKNAVSGCGINCGRRCSNYKKKNVACILLCKLNACDCRKGYVYDDNKKQCVLPKNCTPTCGINEVYSDCKNGGCKAQNCSQLGKDIPCAKKGCIKGCICKKNYLRADNGTCIPQDQCQKPKCGVNQTLEQCPIVLCRPLTCSSVGYPVACPGLAQDGSCPGPPDCICNDNKVKDDNGNCIPADQCPSCGGDPNAVIGCGNKCGKRCSDYKTGATCIGCSFNACDCRKGYVFDENLGKCVPPEQCPPWCQENEIFDICANGGCNKRDCFQRGQPKRCILDPLNCIGACVCQPGYLRNTNATCIPENQCPNICTNPHEVYDPCPSICPPQTCESIGRAYNCPALIEKNPETCHSSCICERGYYRNKIGQCILAKECSQNQTYCPIINKKCNSMCYCEEGYAKDKNNTCIPFQQCEANDTVQDDIGSIV